MADDRKGSQDMLARVARETTSDRLYNGMNLARCLGYVADGTCRLDAQDIGGLAPEVRAGYSVLEMMHFVTRDGSKGGLTLTPAGQFAYDTLCNDGVYDEPERVESNSQSPPANLFDNRSPPGPDTDIPF